MDAITASSTSAAATTIRIHAQPGIQPPWLLGGGYPCVELQKRSHSTRST
jgi:hypothetical protein